MMHMIVYYRNDDHIAIYQYKKNPPEKSVQSIGTQCNLLAVPPLTSFSSSQKKEIIRKIVTQLEEADLTDLDS